MPTQQNAVRLPSSYFSNTRRPFPSQRKLLVSWSFGISRLERITIQVQQGGSFPACCLSFVVHTGASKAQCKGYVKIARPDLKMRLGVPLLFLGNKFRRIACGEYRACNRMQLHATTCKQCTRQLQLAISLGLPYTGSSDAMFQDGGARICASWGQGRYRPPCGGTP